MSTLPLSPQSMRPGMHSHLTLAHVCFVLLLPLLRSSVSTHSSRPQ
jgi:hypothetical protein